jgi:hypothetical protein
LPRAEIVAHPEFMAAPIVTHCVEKRWFVISNVGGRATNATLEQKKARRSAPYRAVS